MNDHDALFEEYKLVQSKIDSIGSFKFHVRGWSITVVSALVLGSLTTAAYGQRAQVFLLGIAGLLVFFFHVLEEEQERVSRVLRKRALHLEGVIDRVRQFKGGRRPIGAPWYRTPQMATDIRMASAVASSRSPQGSWVSSFGNAASGGLLNLIRYLGGAIARPFVGFQLLIITLAVMGVLCGLISSKVAN